MDKKKHIIIIYSLVSIILCLSVLNFYNSLQFIKVVTDIVDLNQIEISNASEILSWLDSVEWLFQILNN